jgi:hypothetical protein
VSIVDSLRTSAWLLLLAACSSNQAAAPLPCPRALDDYCMNASPPCARHLTPSNPTGSFCEQCGAACAFSIENCSDGTVSIVTETSSNASSGVSWRKYLYDAVTLNLTAIVDSSSGGTYKASSACIAGPQTLPDHGTCIDNSLAWMCGAAAADAGSHMSDARSE